MLPMLSVEMHLEFYMGWDASEPYIYALQTPFILCAWSIRDFEELVSCRVWNCTKITFRCIADRQRSGAYHLDEGKPVLKLHTSVVSHSGCSSLCIRKCGRRVAPATHWSPNEKFCTRFCAALILVRVIGVYCCLPTWGTENTPPFGEISVLPIWGIED